MSAIKSVSLPEEPLRQKAIQELIDEGIEPSPENLLERNLKKGSPLYEFFNSLSWEQWASFGRYQAARKIIAKTHVEWNIGGKTIETRAVEITRDSDGSRRYAAMRDILSDPNLRDAYMAEVVSLMEQAQGKMEKLRALMSDEREEAA